MILPASQLLYSNNRRWNLTCCVDGAQRISAGHPGTTCRTLAIGPAPPCFPGPCIPGGLIWGWRSACPPFQSALAARRQGWHRYHQRSLKAWKGWGPERCRRRPRGTGCHLERQAQHQGLEWGWRCGAGQGTGVGVAAAVAGGDALRRLLAVAGECCADCCGPSSRCCGTQCHPDCVVVLMTVAVGTK